MKPIEVGMKAPAFTLDDVNEQPVSLSDFSGKKVLLSWHPIAWTSVCMDQMRALETHWDAFQKLNTVPLGMSVDPTPAKKMWAAALVLENLPLLSDFWPHGQVAQAYGIFHEEFGMSERANILIDEKGYVKWVKVYPMGELPDINEVLEAAAK